MKQYLYFTSIEEMKHCESMDKLVEKFCDFSLGRGFCENMRNFISYVTSKHGVNATIAISFVILGCLPHLIHLLINKRPKLNLEPKSRPDGPKTVPKSTKPLTRSFIIREVHGRFPSLDSLLEDDYKHALISSSTLDNADRLLRAHLEQDFPNLIHVQQYAAKLEMGARENDGEIILEDALRKARAENKPHEAYEIEMLLVEMLIYKGKNSDLEKALKCECLKDELLKDARRPLYLALIYQMQEKKNEAQTWWEEFVTVRDPDDRRRTTNNDIHSGNRSELEYHVHRLKKAIQEGDPEKKMYIAMLLPIVVYIFFTLFSKLRKKSP